MTCASHAWTTGFPRIFIFFVRRNQRASLIDRQHRVERQAHLVERWPGCLQSLCIDFTVDLDDTARWHPENAGVYEQAAQMFEGWLVPPAAAPATVSPPPPPTVKSNARFITVFCDRLSESLPPREPVMKEIAVRLARRGLTLHVANKDKAQGVLIFHRCTSRQRVEWKSIGELCQRFLEEGRHTLIRGWTGCAHRRAGYKHIILATCVPINTNDDPLTAITPDGGEIDRAPFNRLLYISLAWSAKCSDKWRIGIGNETEYQAAADEIATW